MIRPDHSDKPEPWQEPETPKGADPQVVWLLVGLGFCFGAIFASVLVVLWPIQ